MRRDRERGLYKERGAQGRGRSRTRTRRGMRKREKKREGMMEKKEKRQYLRLKSRACCVGLGSPTHRSLIGNQIKNQNQKSNNYIN